jgi:DHA2 family multidrug resistance protein
MRDANAGSALINPWLIAGTVMLATFMEVLDTSVANVALPHIAGNLSATVDEATWVLTSYLVSNAIVLPLAGWFSQLFGRKRFYMLCVVLFTVSSFLCGLAPTLGSLILFRVLQGLGGGAMQPIAQAILVESFPRHKQGMAMAVYGIGVVFAPIIGPTLGGWITDNFTWRWIFLINIPIGALALALASALIWDPPFLVRKKWGGVRIDYIGLGLIALGLAFLEIFLDEGQRNDWFSSGLIATSLVVAVAALAGAVIWELRQRDPVVDLHLLKERNFLISTVTMFLLGFVLYASTMLLPVFLQGLMGYTALLSGLVLSPGGFAIVILMPVVGMLVSRVQPRWLVVFGLAVSAVGLFRMANFNLDVDYRTALMARVVQSAGLAFLFVPINTMAFASISRERTNNATGLINLARNIGGSAGIAMITTLLARRSQFHQHRLVGQLTPLDPRYREMLEGAAALLTAKGSSPPDALHQAHGLLYGMVQRQAAMKAFIDSFWIMGVIFIAMIPLMFVMKKTVPHKARAAAAGH